MQGNPQLPGTPPLPGTTGIPLMNEALQTIATDFSGSDDPAALAWPYARWADTGAGRWRMRNAAGSAWIDLGPLAAEDATPVDGALFASQEWVLARSVPKYAQISVPTTDVGTIIVEGIGVCTFDAVDGKYYRIPTYANRVQLRSSSGTWTPDAFTKYLRLDGGAGGGGGGSGAATGGTGRASGGGAGEAVRDYYYTATPSVAISYTCGVAGTGAGSGTPASGTNGGNSTFGTLTLVGGSGGLASNSANVAGGNGGASATAGVIPGQPGQYAQTSQTFGDGGSCIYGQGGRNNNPNGTGSANATGFCAGAGGTFGTNPNTAGAGFWDVYF